MSPNGASAGELRLESLLDPTDRYELGECIGKGVFSDVYEAKDLQAGNRRVAVKIQRVEPEAMNDIQEEYRILRDLSGHANLPDFYGVYLKKGATKKDDDHLWFVMEMCEGGSVTDLVRGLQEQNKRISEEHIAHILKEVIKALMHLHENHVVHRDVRGSNILLTKEGEVKLVDFGLARELKSTLGKRGSCVGSPCWMAPEVVTSAQSKADGGAYDNRIDVWSLGITAIELGDGKPPFHDMHPTRALFQIVRNPPPGLYRPANWTQDYNDFIAESLEKNPDHRPYIMELMEHPFITSLPENDYHLSQEVKSMIEGVSGAKGRRREPRAEVSVRGGYLKEGKDADPEPMRVEDLAALEDVTEDAVMAELYERLKMGLCHTFVGDVLLVLNPNEQQPIYGDQYHIKYQYKSRSNNSPHIYAVADRAYQDMLHHEEPQHILLAGESLSGKTTNMMHLFRHLLFLGKSGNGAGDKVSTGMHIIQALGNASTPLNPNSTRHILQLQLTFTKTGKVSGGIFWLYQLEKSRVTTRERQQSNFHFFYYFYDAMEAKGNLQKYHLHGGRKYRFLRCEGGAEGGGTVREDAEGNVVKFHAIQQHLTDLDVEEEKIETLYDGVAAVLILGEVQFQNSAEGLAEIRNPECAAKVAQLLHLDEKKFAWSLINYCMIEKGTAVRRRHTLDEAIEARDVLARGVYQRLVDWVVNVVNYKLSFTRSLFGDFHYIGLLDMFGFECFPNNGLEQLFVNTMNEQMQFHYNQRVFVWEMQEQEEEEIPVQTLQYYDNRPTLDALMKKPDGLLYLVDEASKTSQDSHFIMSTLRNTAKGPHLRVSSSHEFSVAHFTGTVTYDAREMSDKNHDFLPPEMIETLRLSANTTVKKLFTNQMSRCGILTFSVEPQPPATTPSVETKKGRWGALLVADSQSRARKYNTESHGQYSQTRGMRTASATFRATSLEVLRGLAVGSGSGGTHFVRCMRSDLSGQARGFQTELVRQQIKALAVVDTARARQKGYPHRVPFPEFIRRYQFLAFDFDETVELTKENSRLLLVRLKMEGWVIGKNKVFLKYYNEEYLSMKYEIQVKKIVKVQTMMRAFLARKNVATKLRRLQSVKSEEKAEKEKKETPTPQASIDEGGMSEEAAALLIQKEFRGYQVRKHIKPLLQPNCDKLEESTADFIRQYCKKWRAKSIYQVLLFYRAARHQDLIYFSQQVHLFNQNSVSGLLSSNQEQVLLDRIDPLGRASQVLGKLQPTVWKLPFRLKDISYFDTTYMCDPLAAKGSAATSTEDDLEAWDAPLRRHSFVSLPTRLNVRDPESQTSLSQCLEVQEYNFTQIPFNRDPNVMERQEALMKNKPINDAYKHQTPQPYAGRKASAVHAVNFKQGSKVNVYNPGKINSSSVTYYGKDNLNNSNAPRENDQHSIKHPQKKKEDWPPPRPISPPSGLQQAKNEYNHLGGQTFGVRRAGSSTPNPIVEMEMKCRSKSNIGTSDDPPFNFQAMLRKTNNNRASLRRNQEINNNSSEREMISSYNQLNINTVQHQPGNWPGDNKLRIQSSNNGGGKTGKLGNRTERNEDEKTFLELAPGIMIQGHVSDL